MQGRSLADWRLLYEVLARRAVTQRRACLRSEDVSRFALACLRLSSPGAGGPQPPAGKGCARPKGTAHPETTIQGRRA